MGATGFKWPNVIGVCRAGPNWYRSFPVGDTFAFIWHKAYLPSFKDCQKRYKSDSVGLSVATSAGIRLVSLVGVVLVHLPFNNYSSLIVY